MHLKNNPSHPPESIGYGHYFAAARHWLTRKKPEAWRAPEGSKNPLTQLPHEMMVGICRELNPNDICALRLVDMFCAQHATSYLVDHHASGIVYIHLEGLSAGRKRSLRKASDWYNTPFASRCLARATYLAFDNLRLEKQPLGIASVHTPRGSAYKALLSRTGNLSKFSIVEWGPLDEDVVVSIAQRTHLKLLSITQKYPRSDILWPLMQMRGLEGLDMTGLRHDSFAPLIRASPKLHCLKLSEGPRPSSDELGAIASLEHLTDLDLSYRNLEDEDVLQIARAPALLRLDLTGGLVSDAAMRALVGTPTLQQLVAGYVKCTDEGLDALSRLPRLEILIMNSVEATDRGLKALWRMPALKHVSLGREKMTAAKMQAFCDQKKGLETFHCNIDHYRQLKGPVRKLLIGTRRDFSSGTDIDGLQTVSDHRWYYTKTEPGQTSDPTGFRWYMRDCFQVMSQW